MARPIPVGWPVCVFINWLRGTPIFSKALIAVGVVWTVVNNIVERGAESIDVTAKCIEIDVEVSQSQCSPEGSCNVTILRNGGGDVIGGVKLIFNNVTRETNYVHTVAGDITLLETKTEKNIVTGIGNVNSIEVNAPASNPLRACKMSSVCNAIYYENTALTFSNAPVFDGKASVNALLVSSSVSSSTVNPIARI